MMDVGELKDALSRLPVPADAYVLDESVRDESYVIQHTGTEWTVFYAERGQRTGEERFSSEDDACRELLRRLTAAFGPEDTPASETGRLATFVTAVDAERRLDPAQRSTRATDESLDGVRAHLQQAAACMRTGQADGALKALELVRYHVAESWSFQSPLANSLLDYVSDLERARLRKPRNAT